MRGKLASRAVAPAGCVMFIVGGLGLFAINPNHGELATVRGGTHFSQWTGLGTCSFELGLTPCFNDPNSFT